jgi:acetyl esterase
MQTRLGRFPERPVRSCLVALLSFAALVNVSHTQVPRSGPTIEIYKTVSGVKLTAHVFRPDGASRGGRRAAIILLHGGGWTDGDPEWTYDDAQRYAGLGLVAIAGEYRLSDRKTITPLEAMADVRDLVRWVRENASELGVDPHRVALEGISAGGHLAAGAAVFPHPEESKTSAVPDALILLSPAVSIAHDPWPQLLLGSRSEVKAISPVENIEKPLPPVLMIEGTADTETPLAGAQRFCDRAIQVGGTCEIHLFPGVGHLLTRNLDPHAQEEGPFDPAPEALKETYAEEAAFLLRIGFMKQP